MGAAATVSLFACLMATAPVRAQPSGGADGTPGPVVQQLPNSDSMNLNAALARLGRNPRDMDALIEAGQAALTVGDVDAAIGFFRRAEQVTPGNPRVKAGLARALVRSGNPYDALPLFDDAERAGAMDPAIALDRGLAYDLVADNASAQRYYRQALAGGQSDEATRRLAISLAIAGDKRASGTTLSPLLMRQDKASWRARAFALAIMGQTDEAITVVNGTLPTGLAAGIAPYLRYMPRLTPAQQAAAANFGQFPRASEIGRDDPRVALYAAPTGRRPALASADAGLIPKGEPLGRNARSRDNRDSRSGTRNANTQREQQRPPEVAVAETPAERLAAAFPPARLQPAPVPAASTPAAPTPAARAPAAAAPAAIAPVQPAPAPRSLAADPPVPAVPAAPAIAARPALAVAAPVPAVVAPIARAPALAATPVPAPATATAPTPTLPASAPAVQPKPSAAPVLPPIPPTPRRQSLAEAFSDLGRPTADASPASGAVDIRRIRPARVPGAGAATAVPAAPVHPSRIWVQLATGRDKAALGYDFRRISREAETAFKSRRAFVSNWGQTNRLLTGPFDSEAAANAFLGQLRRADVNGAFVWTSPTGQVVDALAAR